MRFFYVGEFSKPIEPAAVIHIKSPADTETLLPGDVVEKWGHIFEWDKHCLKASQLEQWRSSGDPRCDAAVESMFSNISSSPGIDLYDRLLADAALNSDGPSRTFLEEAYKPPPSDIAATPEQFHEGQAFFATHAVAIMQALLHYSLAGGFASPRITRVLQSVSYLVPPPGDGSVESQIAGISQLTKDRTFSRLLETIQFVLDVMGCTGPAISQAKGQGESASMNPINCMEPGGIGWKSALRVRLLHGIARRRILDKLPKNGYLLAEDGIPINQEDMAATLGAFSVAPLWCLKRLYYLAIPSPTPSQASAFIAMWRHIGYYLGVDPAILREHFASPKVATKLLTSSVLHVFPSEESDNKILLPTVPILLAVSDRSPFPSSFARHCALTRLVLGASLASHLGVPDTPLRERVKLMFSLVAGQIPVYFSHLYPRRNWSLKHRELTLEALGRIVRFQMGMRRTTFRARNEGGELDPDVVLQETVKPDPVGASRMVREYRMLMVEMTIVLIAVISSFAWGLSTLVAYTISLSPMV